MEKRGVRLGIVRIFTNWAMGRSPFLTKKGLDERMKKVQKIAYEGVERDVQKRHDEIAEGVAARQPYCR